MNKKDKTFTRFLRKTTKVEVLGMLKKTQRAREFRMSATRKRTLYKQGKTTAVTLSSRSHLMEPLETVMFIF